MASSSYHLSSAHSLSYCIFVSVSSGHCCCSCPSVILSHFVNLYINSSCVVCVVGLAWREGMGVLGGWGGRMRGGGYKECLIGVDSPSLTLPLPLSCSMYIVFEPGILDIV